MLMPKKAYRRRRVHVDKGGPAAQECRNGGRRAYLDSPQELERQFETAIQKCRAQVANRQFGSEINNTITNRARGLR